MRTARLLCLLLLPLLAAARPARGGVFEVRRAYREAGADRVAVAHQDAEGDGKQTVYVGKTVLLDQNAVKAAALARDSASTAETIRIVLTDAGRARFGKITEELVQERLAILVNGEVIAAPMVVEPILSGELEISGNFDANGAQALVIQLNAAAGKGR